MWDVHPPDQVRGKPVSPWEVYLRNNVKPFNICKVEGQFCLEVPYRVKDSIYLTYKEACLQVRLVGGASGEMLTIQTRGG